MRTSKGPVTEESAQEIKKRGCFTKRLKAGVLNHLFLKLKEKEGSSDVGMNGRGREQRPTDWITELEQEDKRSHK